MILRPCPLLHLVVVASVALSGCGGVTTVYPTDGGSDVGPDTDTIERPDEVDGADTPDIADGRDFTDADVDDVPQDRGPDGPDLPGLPCVNQDCPVPVAVVNAAQLTSTTLIGNPGGGTAFDDPCPPGQALIGFVAQVGGSIDGLAGLCGELRVQGDGGAGPFPVTVQTGVTLPRRGGLNNEMTLTCEADQVVVGFDSRAGLLVDQISLRCTTLSVEVTGSDPVLTVTLGASVTTVGPVGGSGGEVQPRADCPAGQIAFASRGRAGNNLDAISVGCAIPQALTCRPAGASLAEGPCCQDLLTCSGRCTDPDTDRNFCGASGDCTGPDAGETCALDRGCAGGVCEDLCAGVACTAQDACHVAGVCNPDNGICSAPPGNEGGGCDDQDSCTVLDSCENGTCVGGSSPCLNGASCQDQGASFSCSCVGGFTGQTCEIPPPPPEP